MRRLGFFLFVAFSLSAEAKEKLYTNLQEHCGRPGYACGECESSLQNEFNQLLAKYADVPASGDWSSLGGNVRLKPGANMDQFLKEASDLMRKNNPKGNGYLNSIVIGHSDSLQGTTPGKPRVALKSPDGEFMLTFNTDPSAPGYNNVEVMRWDGKNGTYKFQELEFPGGKSDGGHADFSGSKCVRCHREPPRPNWETYRAWSSVIPPRDDMVEKSEHGEKLDLAGASYIDFLRQVAAAKKNPAGANARLALLDIPGDAASEEQKIKAIENEALTNGFYRVPHIPARQAYASEGLKSYSPRNTALLAGASHLAFDQMNGQQSCQIATQLKKNPNFDKFKYALTGLLKCSPVDRKGKSVEDGGKGWGDFDKYLPPSYTKAAGEYFQKSDTLLLANRRVQVSSGDGAKPVLNALLEHTKGSQDEVTRAKSVRAIDWMKGWGNRIGYDGVDAGVNELLTKTTPLRRNYNAIADPGGVKSVGEKDPGLIAAVRYLLEPQGVNVGAWSLANGANMGAPTYSFSDLFGDMLAEQEIFDQIMDQTPGATRDAKCKKLQDLSRKALGGQDDFVGAGGGDNQFLKDLCAGGRGLTQAEVAEKVKNELGEKTCMVCHSFEHPDVGSLFQKSPHDSKSFLDSKYDGDKNWADRVRQMLNEGRMPPGGFGVGSTQAEKIKNDKDRRDALLQYVDYLDKGESSNGLRCPSSQNPPASGTTAKPGVD